MVALSRCVFVVLALITFPDHSFFSS